MWWRLEYELKGVNLSTVALSDLFNNSLNQFILLYDHMLIEPPHL